MALRDLVGLLVREAGSLPEEQPNLIDGLQGVSDEVQEARKNRKLRTTRSAFRYDLSLPKLPHHRHLPARPRHNPAPVTFLSGLAALRCRR
jgi:hypothetical protein